MTPNDISNGRISELEILVRAANDKFNELRGYL